VVLLSIFEFRVVFLQIFKDSAEVFGDLGQLRMRKAIDFLEEHDHLVELVLAGLVRLQKTCELLLRVINDIVIFVHINYHFRLHHDSLCRLHVQGTVGLLGLA